MPGPFNVGKNAKIKLPRELQDDQKIAEQIRLLDKALEAWETIARQTVAENQKVRDVIADLRDAIVRSQRKYDRDSVVERSVACDALMRESQRLLDLVSIR